MAEMPFTNDGSVVTGLLEALGHEPFAGIEAVGGSSGNDHGLQSVAERITAGHQRRPRRRAHGLHVELRELRAASRQRVNVRCLNVGRTVESDVLPPEIVCNDVENVRLACGRFSSCRFARLRVRKWNQRNCSGAKRQRLQETNWRFHGVVAFVIPSPRFARQWRARIGGGLEFESSDSITAPSGRQQLNYYKIASIGFERTTLIYTQRILPLLLSTRQLQSDMNGPG